MIELDNENNVNVINDLNEILNIFKTISYNPQIYGKKTEEAKTLVKEQIDNIRNVIRKGNLDNYFDVQINVTIKM